MSFRRASADLFCNEELAKPSFSRYPAAVLA
jgi:hypothetical protein